MTTPKAMVNTWLRETLSTILIEVIHIDIIWGSVIMGYSGSFSVIFASSLNDCTCSSNHLAIILSFRDPRWYISHLCLMRENPFFSCLKQYITVSISTHICISHLYSIFNIKCLIHYTLSMVGYTLSLLISRRLIL